MNIFVGLKERQKQNFKERKYSQLMMVTYLVVGLGSEAPQEPLIKIFIVIKVSYLIHWKMKAYHQVTQKRNIIIIIIVIIITSVIVLGYLKKETTRETTFSNYYLISL